jgi:hypothetical protein
MLDRGPLARADALFAFWRFFPLRLDALWRAASRSGLAGRVRTRSESGLPDGIVWNQKLQIWVNFGGLTMKEVGIFYGHLVYFTAIWYIFFCFYGILYIFLLFHGHFVHFSHFGISNQDKSGNPVRNSSRSEFPSCPDLKNRAFFFQDQRNAKFLSVGICAH